MGLGTDLVAFSGLKGHVFGGPDEVYANWDGQWYRKIASEGYTYDPAAHSTVAFFPAYPLLAGLISRLSGLGPGMSLLIVSNVSLILTFIIFFQYIKNRQRSSGSPRFLADYSLLAMGLLPTSFFFRMAYSESLFLLVTVVFLHAIERRWPLGCIAAVVGLATSCRPVGICLIPPLVLYAWHRSPTIALFLKKLAISLPLACLGIGGYMIYLWHRFGAPFAFAQTQIHWAERTPASVWEKFVALATLEPFRRIFDPSCYAYLGNYEPRVPILLSMHFADPFLFAASLSLVAVGTYKRWLTSYESVASFLLLLFPYWTSGYETYMRSIGRYSSAAVPIYLVLGHLICRVPGPISSALLGITSFLLGIYTALFVAWYKFY